MSTEPAAAAPGEDIGPERRGIAITALVLGIATAALFALGWLLAAITPGMGALGIAVLFLMIVGVVGVPSLIVGIVAVTASRAKVLAWTGLGLTIATAIILGSLFVPWSSLFA